MYNYVKCVCICVTVFLMLQMVCNFVIIFLKLVSLDFKTSWKMFTRGEGGVCSLVKFNSSQTCTEASVSSAIEIFGRDFNRNFIKAKIMGISSPGGQTNGSLISSSSSSDHPWLLGWLWLAQTSSNQFLPVVAHARWTEPGIAWLITSLLLWTSTREVV